MRSRSSIAPLLLAGAALFGQSPYGRPLAVRGVGIDQKLNGALPLDASFTDESGRPVQLRQFFQGTRPVLLSLVYYQCPMLCNMVLNGETRTMREMKLEPGRDYDVVTISFDSKEKTPLAAAKKATYVEKLGKPGAAGAWHFLTGDEENIRSLTQAVGFRYRWDETTKQWAHASGIIVVTPDARISRYLYGVDFQPRDLRLALVEASKNKIGRITDQILLLCYHYDPSQGKYTVAVFKTMRVAGTATLALLGAFVFISLRRDRRSKV